MAHLTIARVGTGLTATSAIVMSLGSVTAAADATLTGTEVDYLFSGAATLSSGAGLYSTHQTGAPLSNIKNGTTTDHSGVPYDVYLDMATPDAGSTGNDALTVNGTVILTWTKLGDY
jgi:hypothetical protein